MKVCESFDLILLFLLFFVAYTSSFDPILLLLLFFVAYISFQIAVFRFPK